MLCERWSLSCLGWPEMSMPTNMKMNATDSSEHWWMRASVASTVGARLAGMEGLAAALSDAASNA